MCSASLQEEVERLTTSAESGGALGVGTDRYLTGPPAGALPPGAALRPVRVHYARCWTQLCGGPGCGDPGGWYGGTLWLWVHHCCGIPPGSQRCKGLCCRSFFTLLRCRKGSSMETAAKHAARGAMARNRNRLL